MTTFAVIATRTTETNARLGTVLAPGRALALLRPGDVALGRLDVLRSLDGIERGLWSLDALGARGVRVFNPSHALAAAHDKLATAEALAAARVPHPRTVQLAPWAGLPSFELPLVLKPRYGSWGADVFRCETLRDLASALRQIRNRVWWSRAGGVLQELVEPRGYDLRLVVAGGAVVGAIRRVAAPGEWRTNVALGARRVPVEPPPEACALAMRAAAAVGGDLVGVDLLPLADGWTVLEVNGAVEFTPAYAMGEEIFAAARDALLGRALVAA